MVGGGDDCRFNMADSLWAVKLVFPGETRLALGEVKMSNQRMKKICIINTGGTIGMRETANGLRPEPGFLIERMSQMPELNQEPMPEFEIVEYDPLIDSSNMVPEQWLKIAHDIQQRYFDYSGFVVIHGTDTMAYTASALPFILGPIAKPIILTGSQLPLSQVRSDARENLKTAMLLAGNYNIPEVCLLFGDQLLRGCRSTKSSATSFDAFESPNFPALGTIGTSIDIASRGMLKPAELNHLPIAKSIQSYEMATFRLFPGMSTDVLKNVLQTPLKALIVESYGVGNGPSTSPDFLAALQSAADNGIVIVSCSQCKSAYVQQTDYETGRALLNAGLVSGRDMTLEAAIAKLHFLFSNYDSVDEIKRLMGTDLAGELTDRNQG